MKAEDILKEIEESIEKPFVTAQFGDNWKKHALDNYDLEVVINIAWKQGRRALLLERELLKQLEINELKSQEISIYEKMQKD